jgi:hypothetical protein
VKITATTVKIAKTPIDAKVPLLLSRRAIAMTGHNSPKAPCLRTAEPSFVSSCPLSFRIGSSVPSAVETRAMATAISACIAPVSPTRPRARAKRD